jgi:NADH-quinone oxidoreductase subunit M
MMLISLIALPFVCALILALCSSFSKGHWSLSLFCTVLSSVLLFLCFLNGQVDISIPWIPNWGLAFHLRMDSLSLALLAVAHLMVLLALLLSCRQEKSPWFYFNILMLLASINGVLLAFDLLLFFLFWEGMIIPIYFLTRCFGHQLNNRAATQFFILTQSSGLFMLVAILGLCILGFMQEGSFSFDPEVLSSVIVEPKIEFLLLLAFLFPFLVKLPAVPFHVWLPELFVEAPVSALLLGIMVKTGAYGIIRFALPLFPNAALALTPTMMGIGIFTLFFGALMAYSQQDIRRILAYGTISHMGLILMAIFAKERLAMTGAVILLVTGALNTGSLLLLVDDLKRYHLSQIGGLFGAIPKRSVVMIALLMSSLGLPVFGQFVGEWLVVVGIFSASPGIAVIAAIGLVVSAVFHLRLAKHLLFGPKKGTEGLPELSGKRLMIYGCLISLMLLIGLYPAPFIAMLKNTTVEDRGY